MILFSNFPRYIKFIITLRCNLKCKHCGSYKKYSKEMPTSDVFRIIDIIAKTYKLRKKPVIRITGGEPFVRNDILDIVDYISRKNFTISINTNGTLITNTMLTRLMDSSIRYMHVSVDGSKPDVHDKIRGIPGAFEQTIGFLSLLRSLNKNKKIDVKIFSAIQEDNVDDLKNIVTLVHQLDFPIKFIHPIFWDKRYCSQASDPEGRLWIRSGNSELGNKVYNFMAWLDSYKRNNTVSFSPKIKKEELLSYYSASNNFKRQRCSVIHSELRIRPEGTVAICEVLDGMVCDWHTINSISKVFNIKEFGMLRKRIKEEGLFPFCMRCIKAE